VKDANPRVTLEFYLISSGIGDVLRNMPIADEFTDIWASEFHYGAVCRSVLPWRRAVIRGDKAPSYILNN